MSVWYQMGQSVRNLLISLTITSKAILDTESNIQARTDDELGTIMPRTLINCMFLQILDGLLNSFDYNNH